MDDTPLDSRAVAAAAGCVTAARELVVFTGAGIGSESGIPDFRSPGGLWTRYDPRELTFQKFCASAETRRLYWEMGASLYPALQAARPNRAHLALAAIERRGGLRRIVTQNIDGLHQRAGSSGEKVIEIPAPRSRSRVSRAASVGSRAGAGALRGRRRRSALRVRRATEAGDDLVRASDAGA